MKKNILLSALFLFLSISFSYSQISHGGKPFSYQSSLHSEVSDVQQMPSFSVQEMLNEDESNKDKNIPYRFGKIFQVELGLSNSGTWETLENGDRLWKLGIESKGAYSINLTFSKYILPEGARLFIYNQDQSMHIGAFTNENNQKDGKLGTRPVQGGSIVIEYYEPKKVAGEGQVTVGEVVHGYRNVFFSQVADEAYGFGGSGSCHINVVCTQGAAYTDHKNAVVLVVLGGGLCSGALVNNTRQDGTPYVLTADHCFAAATDVSTWVYVFDYESPGCATTTEGPTNNTVSGSVLRAHSAVSDFCLVELNTRPLSSYNPYYAGWSRVNTAPLSGVGIHHPAGDVKKISTATTSLFATDWNGAGTINHWEVSGWNSGSTEGGSSGSPFFDQNKRVIGQLHGGSSTPCPGSSKVSIYGGLWYSWDQCGSTADVRLQNWLDPTNTAVTTLNGGYFVNVACTTPVTAGTTASSANGVCTGQMFSLSLSGTSGGAGLAYQWQSSSNGSTWTNISAATNSSYTTSQAASTYYRCNVGCGASTAYSTSLQVTNSGGTCYCATSLGGGSCSGDNITNVTISGTTLNNTSTCTVAANGDAYINYPATGTTTASVLAGSAYSLGVTTDGYDIVSVWIDYNRNGVFESSEWQQVTSSSSAGFASTISVTIPVSALSGTTGMRIRSRASGNSNGSTDACSNFGSGETEDYTITISQPVACTAPPTAGTANASPTSVCPGVSFNLSLSGVSSGTGLSYSWQSSPNNSTWTNIGAATTSTYTGTLSSSTYYRCNVTCSGSTVASSSALVSLSSNCSYLVPFSGSSTITTCSGTVYDNGGSAGSYSNSSNGTLVIYPGVAGNYVNLNFTSFSVETCCDRLYIYDGTSTGAALIGTYTSSPGTIYATNASGALTLNFYSDGSVTSTGFAADITCITSIPQSDLSIQTPYLGSTNVPAGNSIFASCYAANTGAGTASSSNVGYYLSTNTIWDAADVYLGYTSGSSLAVSATSYRSSNIVIPAGTTPGNYYIIYFADYNASVSESNEANNTSSLALTVAVPTVDLIIQTPGMSPTATVSGNTAYASCYIYNQGNSVSSSSNVGYYLSTDPAFDASDVFLGSTTGSALSAASSGYRTCTLTIPAGTGAGSYYILYFADYNLAITETIESNNVSTVAVTVSSPVIDLNILTPSVSPAALVKGNTTFVSCYANNIGNSQASSSNVGYYLSADAVYDASDVFLGSSAGTTLSAGTSSYRSSTVTIPAGTASGSYYMLYFADYSNALSESNESNNVSYVAVTVTDPTIDLIIQTPAVSPIALVKGNTGFVSCYIYNQGNSLATSSNAGYYLSTDNVYDASDVFLGSSAGVSLSAGTSSYRSMSVTIPAGASSGSYYILFFADYSNAVAEADESNNVNSVAVSVADPFTDLIMQTVSVSSTSITAGNSFTAYGYIYNQGNTASGSSNVGYYLSTDPNYDASDVYLGAYAGTGLSALSSSYRSSTFTISSGTAGGNYYLLYFADYSGAVAESNESNNVTSLAITIMPFGSQVMVPTTGTATATSCLGSVVDNGGASGNYANYSNGTLTIYPATAGNYVRLNFTSFAVETCCDRLYIYDGTSTGATLIGTYTSSPGTIYATNASGALTLNFYSDGSVTYSGFSADITCVASIPQPDLTLNTLTLSSASAAAGASVTVSSYINNLGYTSSSSNVGYYLSTDSIYDPADVYLNYSFGGTLSSGTQAYKSSTLVIPAGTVPGNYYILYFADYSGVVTEGDETNNVKNKPLTIIPPTFDLIIQSPSISTTLVKGNTISASGYIYNQGNSQASSSNVGYYLSTDAIYDASDIFLSSSTGGTLNSLVSSYRSTSFVIPLATASGSYYILYFADYGNAVSETNESNNVYSIAVTVSDPTIDLSIQSPYVSLTTITKGSSASVSCYIFNGGNSQSTSSNAGYYLSSDALYDASDVFLSSSSGTTLSPSSSSYRSATITIPVATASGSYYILYFADYSGAVSETSETNNVNYLAVTVVDPTIDLLTQTLYVGSTTIIKGNSASVSCYIYNGGNSMASSSNVGYYLSSDAIFDASDIFLSSTAGTTLGSLASSYRSSTITIPAGTASGSYYILYFADYSGAVIETNETNNVSSLLITVTDPSIDLIIQTPAATPVSIVAGGATSASAYIYNQGTSSAASSNIGYYLSSDAVYDASDVYLGANTGTSLSSGSSSYRVTSLTIPAGTVVGNYYLLFFADYSAAVIETNEANNVSSVAITVVASSIDLIMQSQSASPATLNAGGSLTATSYIYNQGNTSAASSNVGYYLSTNTIWDVSDIYLGSYSGGALASLTSSYRSTTLTIPAGTANGNYYILFYADYSGAVSESNESNNVISSLITIAAPTIDLIMQAPTATPTTPNAGASVSLTSYIYNQGNTSASSSNVGYYLSTNNIWDASDVYLGAYAGGSLASLASSYRSSTIIIPAGTTIGNYYILYYADYNGSESESDETNNVSNVAITVTAVGSTILVPAVGSTSVTTCSGTIYDNGGTSNYANNSDGTLTINPGTGGSKVRLTFTSFSLETCCDFMEIYDGTSVGATLIGSYTSTPGVITATSASGALTVRFYSDGSITYSGFTADISCVTTAANPDLVVQSPSLSSGTVLAGNAITASCTVANTGTASAASSAVGYYLSTNTLWDVADIYLSYSAGSTLAVSATGSRSSGLTIPGSTVAGNYYILYFADYNYAVTETDETNNVSYMAITVTNAPLTMVPASGSISVTVCTGTIYDNGGTSNYANNSDGTLTINPGTAGSMVRLNFTSFTLETCCDYMQIYDGTSVAAQLIGSYIYSPGIITATSASGALTVRFVSDGSVTYSGFTADISCVTTAANPDLVIQSPSLSAGTVLAGNAVTASCTIANSGTASATSSAVGYYLSTNTVWDVADIYLSYSAGSALASSATASRSSSVTIPGSTMAGNYYILYFADYAGVVSETNESNNVSYVAITITNPAGIPDFIIQSPTLSTGTITAGNFLTVTCGVKNQGAGSSPIASSTGYYLSTNTVYDASDVYLSSSSLTGLAAGATQSLNFSVTIPASTTPGSYYVIFFADNVSSVAESNEGNNVSYVPFQVTAVTAVSNSYSALIIGIYPNPTDGISNVRMEGIADGQVNLSVYDAFGSKVLSDKATVSGNILDTQVELSHFAAGIYTLKIEHSNGNSVVKIILNK
jgi:trimeric autotransporter adhesin